MITGIPHQPTHLHTHSHTHTHARVRTLSPPKKRFIDLHAVSSIVVSSINQSIEQEHKKKTSPLSTSTFAPRSSQIAIPFSTKKKIRNVCKPPGYTTCNYLHQVISIRASLWTSPHSPIYMIYWFLSSHTLAHISVRHVCFFSAFVCPRLRPMGLPRSCRSTRIAKALSYNQSQSQLFFPNRRVMLRSRAWDAS